EAEAGDLAQRAVIDLERRERTRKVLDRRVPEARLLVVQDEMAVRERPALRVLAGQPDVRALGQKRREREPLGVAEVDPAFVERSGPALDQRLAQLAMDGEAVRDLEQLVVQRPQLLVGDGGVDVRALAAVELAGARRHRRVLVLATLHLLAQLLELRREPVA